MEVTIKSMKGAAEEKIQHIDFGKKLKRVKVESRKNRKMLQQSK